MKRILPLVFACLMLATVLCAQGTPLVETAAGYSMIEVGKGYTFRLDGGSTSVAFNLNNWLGFVGDFGAYHGTPGVDMNAQTYLFGPRVSYRSWSRVTPFVQALVGGLHASAISTGFTDAHNAFAYDFGGGADLVLDRGGRFAFRPQLEFLGLRSNGGIITNTGRLSGSIVFRFGRK